MIVERETWDLVNAIEDLLEEAEGAEEEIKPELHESVLEIATKDAKAASAVYFNEYLPVRVEQMALVEKLKTSSSKWLKTQSPDLAAFSWQRGYGCFSVGPTDLDSLCAYIDQQEEHHRTRTFQDEFRMFLKKYGVEYDEAYVWD